MPSDAWQVAEGTYAFYAIPFNPFWAGLPVYFWERDEDEGHIVGLVPQGTSFVPAHQAQTGQFVAYVRTNDDQGQVAALQAEAIKQGQALASQYQRRIVEAQRQPSQARVHIHPAPLSYTDIAYQAAALGDDGDEDDDDPPPPPVAIVSRRNRRRRRNAQEATS